MRRKKLTAVRYLVVHAAYTTPRMKVDARRIDRWHREKGFHSIGYHYVIKRDGTLEHGREELEQGAHARGFNHLSIGICLVGGAKRVSKGKIEPEENYTPEQYKALRALLGYLKKKYPDAEILGHRDLPRVKKACPCFDVMDWWHQPLGVTEE